LARRSGKVRHCEGEFIEIRGYLVRRRSAPYRSCSRAQHCVLPDEVLLKPAREDVHDCWAWVVRVIAGFPPGSRRSVRTHRENAALDGTTNRQPTVATAWYSEGGSKAGAGVSQVSGTDGTDGREVTRCTALPDRTTGSMGTVIPGRSPKAAAATARTANTTGLIAFPLQFGILSSGGKIVFGKPRVKTRKAAPGGSADLGNR
jgi:hypothetical protein